MDWIWVNYGLQAEHPLGSLWLPVWAPNANMTAAQRAGQHGLLPHWEILPYPGIVVYARKLVGASNRLTIFTSLGLTRLEPYLGTGADSAVRVSRGW